MTSLRSILGPAALLTASLAASAHARAQQAAVVRVAPVEREALDRHERVLGSLRAVSRATIAALEEGRLVEVAADEGDLVTADEVLARTDVRRLEAQLDEQRATLEAAKTLIRQREAELEDAKSDVLQYEAAAASNAIAQRTLRQARTAQAVAEVRLDAARRDLPVIESRISYLEVRIADAEVKAPFAARVVERHAEPGEWLMPSAPIVTLVSTGPVEAWFDVPERLLEGVRGRIGRGEAVEVKLEGLTGKREARGLRLVPQVDPRVRTFQLVGTIADEKGELLPGMSLEAWLPNGAREERLLVPADALVRRPGGTFVFEVTGDEGARTAVQVPVDVLFQAGGRVAVDGFGQLAEGDVVVIEGNERLLPGAPVAEFRSGAKEGPADRRYAQAEGDRD